MYPATSLFVAAILMSLAMKAAGIYRRRRRDDLGSRALHDLHDLLPSARVAIWFFCVGVLGFVLADVFRPAPNYLRKPAVQERMDEIAANVGTIELCLVMLGLGIWIGVHRGPIEVRERDSEFSRLVHDAKAARASRDRGPSPEAGGADTAAQS